MPSYIGPIGGMSYGIAVSKIRGGYPDADMIVHLLTRIYFSNTHIFIHPIKHSKISREKRHLKKLHLLVTVCGSGGLRSYGGCVWILNQCVRLEPLCEAGVYCGCRWRPSAAAVRVKPQLPYEHKTCAYLSERIP